MDPEPPTLSDFLRDLRDSLVNLLLSVTAPLSSTSATAAWLRLLILAIGMTGAYYGMKAVLGDLPDIFEGLGKFFRNLLDLLRVLSRLFVPAPEPGGAGGAGLPGTPTASWPARYAILLASWNPDNLQDILLFFIFPVIWAMGRAVEVFYDTYRPNGYRAAAENLLAAYIPLFRRDMAVMGANLVLDANTIHPRRVGGPFRVEVDADSGAVMEPVQGNPRLVTSTPQPEQVDAFERLFRILDLRPQQLELDEELLTRDGIQVQLRNAHFGYRVRQGENGVDTLAVMQLTYHHWLGKTWENPTLRQQDTRRLVQRELAQFIGDQKVLSDLVPDAGQVLQEFVYYFNNLSEHGLQLSWEGDGEWVLPEELLLPDLAAPLEVTLQNQAMRQEMAQMIPGQLRQVEIQRLANLILQRSAELDAAGADLDAKVAGLQAVYAELLTPPPAAEE